MESYGNRLIIFQCLGEVGRLPAALGNRVLQVCIQSLRILQVAVSIFCPTHSMESHTEYGPSTERTPHLGCEWQGQQ